MLGDGGSQKEVLRPDFNRSILVDFQGAKISVKGSLKSYQQGGIKVYHLV